MDELAVEVVPGMPVGVVVHSTVEVLLLRGLVCRRVLGCHR